MADKMKFTRQNFIDYVFQPYNTAVKRGEYNKIEYDDWRMIRGWAYDETWSTHTITIEELGASYRIGLSHDLRTCPDYYYADKYDTAFGSWIKAHRMEIMMWDMDIRAAIAAPVSISAHNSSVSFNNYDYEPVLSQYCAGEISFNETLDRLEDKLNQVIEKSIKNEKENKNMKFGNFDFGPVDSSVRMSLYGMAIKNASGAYVAYDTNSKQVMDVDIFNFDGANKFIYKMPAAIKDIRIGDVVIHARKPMFVQAVKGENRLSVLDIFDGEEKTIVLTKSPFGFDFITKVVSLIDMTGTATKGNPFGNMLPFLMLSDGKGMDDVLPFLLMSQGGNFASNPMLMYALLGKDGKTNDILPFLMMSSCANPILPTGCNGNCKCHEETGSANK